MTTTDDNVNTVNTDDKINNDMFETRKFKDDLEYKVLVLDSPEKWEDADQITFKENIQRGTKSYQAQFKCIPFSTNAYLNESHPIPDENSIPDKSAYELELETAKMSRRVIMIEQALGVTFPGENLTGKINHLSKFGGVYIDRISDIISNQACCLADGDMVEFYNRSSELGVVTPTVKSNEDLFNMNEEEPTSFFRFQRPFQDFMIEMPLKSLTTEERSRIEHENRIPDPPRRPGKGFDTRNPVPWPEEPSYKAKVAKIKIRKMIDYIQTCLPFEIPGNNPQEKYNWISKKPAGDILKLQLFIQSELVDYTWGVNFF